MIKFIPVVVFVVLEYIMISFIFKRFDIWNIQNGFLNVLLAMNIFFGIYYYVVCVFAGKQIKKYNDKLDKYEAKKIHDD